MRQDNSRSTFMGQERLKLQNSSNPLDIRAMIFDLDGVVLDYKKRYAATCELIFSRHNLALDTRMLLLGRRRGNSTQKAVLNALLERDFTTQESIIDTCLSERLRILEDWQVLKQFDRVIPGAKETLELLGAKGLLLFLATSRKNKENLIKELDLKELSPLFDEILCMSDFKDKNCMIQQILSAYNLRPNECAYVSDVAQELAQAKGLGIRVVGVLTGLEGQSALERSSPDFIVNSIRDIPEILAAPNLGAKPRESLHMRTKR